MPSPHPYDQRVRMVLETPGLAAFWDFVQREDGPHGTGRFVAHTEREGELGYPLDPRNISRLYWNDGPEGAMSDFPLMGRGPFGQAIGFGPPRSDSHLPVLLLPRSSFHNRPLDVKGPGASVSMVVWLIHQEGGHALAGIWHEGTDTCHQATPPVVIERGSRQYGMFAGLTANPGASSAHVSENGLSSFGDRYARHFAVTPERMRKVPPGGSNPELDAGWSAAGFVFDGDSGAVTSYLNGRAEENWIEDPESDEFYAPNARAWKQSSLARFPETGRSLDSHFPVDQYYVPPETSPLDEQIISETATERVVECRYEFTKVREIRQRANDGQFTLLRSRSLVALKANPYWFGHSIYSPPSAQEGGPFTIGRVIHSNRHPTLTAWIGGVAVFNRALSPQEMSSLANIGSPASEESSVIPLSAILERQ